MDDLIPKDFGSAANGVELLSGLRVVHWNSAEDVTLLWSDSKVIQDVIKHERQVWHVFCPIEVLNASLKTADKFRHIHFVGERLKIISSISSGDGKWDKISLRISKVRLALTNLREM